MSVVAHSLEAALVATTSRAKAPACTRFCRPLHRQYALSRERAVRHCRCRAQDPGHQRPAEAKKSLDPLLSDLNRVSVGGFKSRLGVRSMQLPNLTRETLQLSDRALRVMLASNEKEASKLAVELSSFREQLLEEHQDLQGSQFVKVLQVCLHLTHFKALLAFLVLVRHPHSSFVFTW